MKYNYLTILIFCYVDIYCIELLPHFYVVALFAISEQKILKIPKLIVISLK